MKNILLFTFLVLIVLAAVADAGYRKKSCGRYGYYSGGRCVCRKGYYGSYPRCKKVKKCGRNAFWNGKKCVCKPHCKGNPYRKCRHY